MQPQAQSVRHREQKSEQYATDHGDEEKLPEKPGLQITAKQLIAYQAKEQLAQRSKVKNKPDSQRSEQASALTR